MGSEGNKMNDGTSSFQPTEPTLCANGCGFFGSANTNNLCSKCYRDERIKEELAASATAAMGKIVDGYNLQSRESGPSSEPAGKITTVLAAAVAGSSEDGGAAAAAPKASNRCLSCNKKVGVMGFRCRCGSTFCGTHRYPEKHDCEFDFKGVGREAIAKANPVVKADKIDRF